MRTSFRKPPATPIPTTTNANTLRSDIIKIICAIVLPPLGVFLERGCGADLLINLLLTILGCKFTSTRVRPVLQ